MSAQNENISLSMHPDGYLEVVFRGEIAPEPLQRLMDRLVLTLASATSRINLLVDGRFGRISRQPQSINALRKLRHQPNLGQFIILTSTDLRNKNAIHGPSEITTYLTMSLGYSPIYTPNEAEARRLAAA